MGLLMRQRHAVNHERVRQGPSLVLRALDVDSLGHRPATIRPGLEAGVRAVPVLRDERPHDLSERWIGLRTVTLVPPRGGMDLPEILTGSLDRISAPFQAKVLGEPGEYRGRVRSVPPRRQKRNQELGVSRHGYLPPFTVRSAKARHV